MYILAKGILFVKEKGGIVHDRERGVTVISRIGSGKKKEEKSKLRGAAYCRVSTDTEEQTTSYEVQVEYYTKFIQKNSKWELAGIIADDGISDTNTRNEKNSTA